MAGRPTKYRKEFCDRVPELMRDGLSIEEVAAELGVNKTTVYLWAEKHRPFSNALKKGKELSKAWWMKQGRINLKNKAFNSGLWFMNMKNRHGGLTRPKTKRI